MTTHYFCHGFAGSLPHMKCMISSIRRFDKESAFTIVIEGREAEDDMFDWLNRACSESVLLYRLVPMKEVAIQCELAGLDWNAAANGWSSRDRSWMMQACLPYWVLGSQEFSADWFVYVDADVFFFQPLQPIIDALPETAHVGICPHHYAPGRENESAGKYNNGLCLWRNSEISREHALRWGRETLERWQPGHPRTVSHEQKLLDEWPEQLGNACVELPRGCNVGPWQLPSIYMPENPDYGLLLHCKPIVGSDDRIIQIGENFPLQSMHMHEFRRCHGINPITIKGQQWNRSGYPLCAETIESVYKVYEAAIAEFL